METAEEISSKLAKEAEIAVATANQRASDIEREAISKNPRANEVGRYYAQIHKLVYSLLAPDPRHLAVIYGKEYTPTAEEVAKYERNYVANLEAAVAEAFRRIPPPNDLVNEARVVELLLDGNHRIIAE